MRYEEFVGYAVEKLQRHLATELNGIVLRSESAQCNNGVCQQGIMLSAGKNKTAGCELFMDLHDYYLRFEQGTPMETVLNIIAVHIADICATGLPTSVYEKSYGWAREYLLVGNCNEKMNRDQLYRMPHVLKGDLAYRYLLCMDYNGEKNITWVNNELMELWGISHETLRRDAWENMKEKWPPVILPLYEAIRTSLGEHDKEIAAGNEIPMLYLMSNADHLYGASYMFDGEFMANLAERFEDDLVIIPASVHDLLFCRRQEIISIGNLIHMLIEVNGAHCLPEEILSNSIYVYVRKERNISVYQLK